MKTMRAPPTAGLLAVLLLLLLLAPFLALSSRLNAAGRAEEQARRAASSSSPEAAAVPAGQPQQSIPDSIAEATERLLEAQLARKDYPAAVEVLRRMLAVQPGDARLLYRLGLLLASQDPESALVYLDQAATLDPSFSPQVEVLRRGITTARVDGDPAYSLLTSGQALAQIEEWELAAEAFHRSTLLRPDYAEAWAFLGEALQHHPAGEQAASEGLAELQTALELDPDSLSANTLLAMYWSRQEDFDLAVQSIQRAIRLEPANPVLRVQAGSLLATMGDLAGGLAAYQQAVSLAPADPQYLRLLAGFCLKYDHQVRDVALPAARRAVALGPEDPTNLDLMAQVLLALDDRINARRFLQRALQADPDDPFVHLHLGQVYLASGELPAAKDELALAISIAPGSPAAEHARRLMQSYFP